MGDLTDPEALNRVVDETETKLGPIDILVSNAGSSRQQTLAELTLQTWDETMHEHLRAAFLLAQRVIPGMCARHWGRIVFISSVAAFNGGIVGPHYTAAKAGLIGLMHSLAISFASNGVTVNAVAPALIETDMLRELGMVTRRDLSQRVPVGRCGKSEEVADLVFAVLRNPYITGQTILVDGGVYPR
jgi:3-oxoacyl-[acyl-carrier protein] reductase